jgi:hypothetical protein
MESSLVKKFCADGFLAVRGAVAADTVRACVNEIDNELLARGVDPQDAATWTQPVVRLATPESPAFVAAGTSPALWQMYDTLLGPDRWVKREGVGGTIPVRFPSAHDPGDAGWHIDGSYAVEGQWWVNVQSRHRGLLALFLFTDVSEDDAPTELIAGSHLDVPHVLAPYGESGVYSAEVAGQLPASTFQRPRQYATGRAGDVYLCHPFMLHRATWPHRGAHPRIIAQPAVDLHQPFALRDRPDLCPVELAILEGLQA